MGLREGTLWQVLYILLDPTFSVTNFGFEIPSTPIIKYGEFAFQKKYSVGLVAKVSC